jgi:hypothetical protein
MKSATFALSLALIAPAAAAGQPAGRLREVRFTGPSAVDALCACLLDARRNAEAHGRLDFTAEVEFADTGGPVDVTARIWMGVAHAVGRINFAGHVGINDSTLRRAMTIYERDQLDVGQLRRSLARINDIGVFEPLTLADIRVVRRDDGVTADLTIPLRERKRRWWSVSGPVFPGIGSLRASLASRLPPRGRGIFEATTYFISLNVAGFAEPFLALERPVIPGAGATFGLRGLTGAVAAGDADALRTHAPRARLSRHTRWRGARSAGGAGHVGWAAAGRAARLRAAKATPLVAAPRRGSRRQCGACGADSLTSLLSNPHRAPWVDHCGRVVRQWALG